MPFRIAVLILHIFFRSLTSSLMCKCSVSMLISGGGGYGGGGWVQILSFTGVRSGGEGAGEETQQQTSGALSGVWRQKKLHKLLESSSTIK